jgi:hexosaminidase
MRIRILTLAIALAVAGRSETVSKLWSRGYAVIPDPQQVELSSADQPFGPEWMVQRGAGVAEEDVAVEALTQELESRFGLRKTANTSTVVRLEMKAGSVIPGDTADPDKPAIADQAYRIEIGETGVVIVANAPEGLLYGVETLVQLVQPRHGAYYLPLGRITDWPDLHLRHI